MIHLMVYSVNHGQVEYKRLRFGNFTHDSPKPAIQYFLRNYFACIQRSNSERHAFYIVTVLALYESTGRATGTGTASALASASALLKMLKFLVEVFKIKIKNEFL